MSVVLSEHLPLLATAPDGIQKLRGLILELAVRGKLVPQDPNDEPASELLKRIAKERARLEAEGICKKSKPVPPVSTDEQPFALPDGWGWVRLGEIGHDWGQKTPVEPFTYVDVSAIDNARGKIVSPSVVKADDAPSRARKLVRRGTVIYSTVRPYLLNIAVIEHDFLPPPIASTAFAILHPLSGLSSQFVFWYLRSPVFVRYVESVQAGIAYPAVNDAQFFSGLFPLPPLAEQHRIVAKVDELMALCDRLEAEQTDAEAAHAKLVETLLGTLTQSTDDADLAANWQRLAEHFDTLFTTESSLDALKQTILQLAVRGKLVPQDPNDEPASELLKRIAKERAESAIGTTRKKGGETPPLSEDQQPFAVPESWEWTRLGQLVDIVYGKGLPTAELTPDGYEVFGANGIIGRYHTYLYDTPQLLLSCRGAYSGKPNISPPKCFVTSNSLVLQNTWGLLSQKFYFYALTCADKTKIVTGSAQPQVTTTNAEPFPVVVPPLAEQHRIVAKVDELMALCDRLKADLIESRSRQERLAATLIESALEAA